MQCLAYLSFEDHFMPLIFHLQLQRLVRKYIFSQNSDQRRICFNDLYCNSSPFPPIALRSLNMETKCVLKFLELYSKENFALEALRKKTAPCDKHKIYGFPGCFSIHKIIHRIHKAIWFGFF